MKRRSKSSLIVAGLVGLTTMLAGDITATAGIAVTMAQSTPVGDPTFEYYLQITAGPYTVGTTTYPITAGDYIVVSGFTYLASFAGAATAKDWNSYLDTSTSTVTFTYNGSNITNSITYPTGEFRVGPTIELSTPPTPILTYTAYNSSGEVIDSGKIQVMYVVPEPSSVLLLSVGLGTLVLVLLHQRRRICGLNVSAAI